MTCGVVGIVNVAAGAGAGAAGVAGTVGLPAFEPTEQEKAEMIASTNRMMQNVETQIQDANERVDNIQEYGLNPGLQTKEGKMQFNPENGKLEKTYITPLGNKTTSKPLADIESFRYRQAADMSIG